MAACSESSSEDWLPSSDDDSDNSECLEYNEHDVPNPVLQQMLESLPSVEASLTRIGEMMPYAHWDNGYGDQELKEAAERYGVDLIPDLQLVFQFFKFEDAWDTSYGLYRALPFSDLTQMLRDGPVRGPGPWPGILRAHGWIPVGCVDYEFCFNVLNPTTGAIITVDNESSNVSLFSPSIRYSLAKYVETVDHYHQMHPQQEVSRDWRPEGLLKDPDWDSFLTIDIADPQFVYDYELLLSSELAT